MSVLKNEYKQDISGIDHINLGFDSRPKSDQTLRKLFLNPDREGNEPEERTICSAYEVAKRCFSRDKSKIKTFTEYLLSRVKILRVVVPEDTDLNHYFEIMNNRGEQLEKHEVLKARLMKKLGDVERNTFARIWDACADMNLYVQLGFNADIRDQVFEKDWDSIPGDFSELCHILSATEHNTNRQTLSEIPDSFDTEYLNQGTNVQNFIFNRLDYLLWRRLIAGEAFEGVGMNYVRKRLNGFSFTFRTSVEHYYPQNPLSDQRIEKSDVLGVA